MCPRLLIACLAVVLLARLASAEELKPVKVGRGTLTGTVTLARDVDLAPVIKALEAELKTRIDKNIHKAACKEAYKQTVWLVDKGTRGVKNVAVWIMPEKDTQFFDVKELVENKKGFHPVVVLDQPHCHFEPRVVVLFAGYVDPKAPGDPDVPKYVTKPPVQKFYALNPEIKLVHNVKMTLPPRGGQEVNEVIGYSTRSKLDKAIDLTTKSRLKPYDLDEGPIRISCNIHDWMEAWAWALPHPLSTTTDEKGNYKIENVPDSGKVRLFVWHEKAGFINKGGKEGQLIEVKDARPDFTKNTKHDFTITRVAK